MAFPIGAALGMGVDLIGGLVGMIKKKNETPERKPTQYFTRPETDTSNIGLTQGLALRPQLGAAGVGMGTLPMFPPIGAQQQSQDPPMFQMQQQGQQQSSPSSTFGGNFSPQLLDQGMNQPQAKQGQPQTAPAFNAISAYLTNGRRG